MLLLLAALASYLATWALYDRADPLSMDSIRLFLSVLTLVGLAGAPLVLIPQDMRRRVISLLIFLHFTGIIATTLAVVHNPKAIKQLWDRIYRPYLQFFYITNAYHFYAPEPGPAGYMWYRILFVDDSGREVGQWLKVPEVDEKGTPLYPTSLTYVRMMCTMDHGARPRRFPSSTISAGLRSFWKTGSIAFPACSPPASPRPVRAGTRRLNAMMMPPRSRKIRSRPEWARATMLEVKRRARANRAPAPAR